MKPFENIILVFGSFFISTGFYLLYPNVAIQHTNNLVVTTILYFIILSLLLYYGGIMAKCNNPLDEVFETVLLLTSSVITGLLISNRINNYNANKNVQKENFDEEPVAAFFTEDQINDIFIGILANNNNPNREYVDKILKGL